MGMFPHQQGAIIDNFGNMYILSNSAWENAYCFWYYGDFNAY
jgi:hypothetical protein